MARRVTREWGRRTRTGGYRRPMAIRMRSLFAVGLVIAGGVIWQVRGRHTTEQLPLSEASTVTESTGGGIAYDEELHDILSGQILAIPVDQSIILQDPELDAEDTDIAQETEAVMVGATAAEIGLTPVGDAYGSGTASIDFTNGLFQHVIVAVLPEPPVGYQYEGWLVRSKPFDFFSTGRLIQHVDDLKWYLLWTDSVDYSTYRKVIITLEKDDGDPAPDTHVLEGVFE